MTAFMKKIGTVGTQERKAAIKKLTYSMNSHEEPVSGQYVSAVKTEFRLEYNSYAWVPENNGNMIQEVRKNMLEDFRREVYGDVEDYVIKVIQSIYQGQDEQETLAICRDLMKILQEV